MHFFIQGKLNKIMYTCIILHDMIVKDEGECVIDWLDVDDSSLAKAS